MREQWSVEQANEWYRGLGWLRGCNFIGSDCANRLDMFQAYKSEEKLKTAERELAQAQKIGFNTVRIWANFDVYYAEPDSYMEIFERYIALCAKYGQRVMIVLTHEEDLPRGEVFVPKKMGEQHYELGYHQGRTPMTPEELAKKPHHYMQYPEVKPIFMEMIRRTVRKYANDERIFCWNVWNEPGITIGDEAIPLLTEVFAAVREENPIQPLCADVWRGLKPDGSIASDAEQCGFDLSDVISWHCYSDYATFAEQLMLVRRFGRPIFLTEWLHRIQHNDFFEIYPLLCVENVPNYMWGFVVGKTQTHEAWDFLWDEYNAGRMQDLDFTKWQHDLFRPNLRPYDPNEIRLIERFNRLADERDKV